MSPEAPFNAESATKKWVETLQSGSGFNNQQLFEMLEDILNIHRGSKVQPLSEVVLCEESPPRNFHISRIQDEESSYFYVSVVQGADSILEGFKIYGGKRGSNRFTTWWRQDVLIASSLLGYVLADTDVFIQINLIPEQIHQLAGLIWNAHAFTLVEYGEQEVLEELPEIFVNPAYLSRN